MLALAMLFIVAACGESGADDRQAGKSSAVQTVVETFERATGDKLVVESKTTPDQPIIGEATLLGVPPELDDKYGDFGISVYEELGPEKKAWLTNGQRDSEGVYWSYTPPMEEGERGYWSAAKWYGNVGLIWFHPSKEKTVQWERLDNALRQLPNT